MAYYVFIDEKIPLVYNVETGVITKGFGDVLFVDTSGIEQELDKLAKLVDAYEHSLDPRYPPLNTFPNRDNVYKIAGYFKGIFIGFWLSLGILSLILMMLGVKFF
ncbi:tetrahydromethanopterin S-methyltransferase subunit B [Methanocaldococcus indicus]|uniref:tetrahydromethanopterin S-methyltransferase subunit B n=1 Tax=Methanocaldococcus indicus TaxID=213231 RepID=UPI003C6D105B